MKKIWTRWLCIALSLVMTLQLLPLSAFAHAVNRQEWIAEFADSAAARACAEAAGGDYLGGPFALLRAGKAELERYGVLSLTENSTLEGSSVSQPSDEKASEQYILTHKSWYAQDAWAELERFLASQTTPLTPADCATVRVAVIDSGIDATHEDLAGRVTAGWDAVNRAAIASGVNSDVSADSHGTKVAGLIGAASDNGVGIVGAAWTFPVELIPVRVLNSQNKGTVADVVAAIYWAVDEGNADILNLSFGQTLRSVPSAMQTAVRHAVEQGVLVVAAAGNDGEYYKSDEYSYYPAVLDGVLPVGSTAKALGSSYGNYNNYVQRADFSNKPSYESECGKTFFYAPGEELLTTSAGNSYEEFSGTSASTALLSGMLAVLKSCADTTGQPAVENYLSYNKYSYLGGLYYQEYKTMAQALTAGYTSGDVRFAFDGYLPRTLRGTVTLSGILNDPALRYQSVSLSFDGQLVGTAERTEAAKQYIAFTVDTTAIPDGYYYPYQIVLMGTLEDGTQEEIEHSHGFDISNESECCTVTVSSGGAALVGAKGWVFRSGTVGTYQTNALGQIELPVSDAGGASSLLVVGEDLLVFRKLAAYPAGNRYSFGNDPALLTIRCSGDTLAAADGAAIFVTMPDGGRYEVGKITGGKTELWVDTDSPITFTVCGAGVLLSETVDLSGEDAVWDLDSTETAKITLTHDGKAPTEGTEGAVRFLGLELGGFDEQLLNPEGGSVLVTPGEYSVTGYVYWCDGNYYSTYMKAELGTQNVTQEGMSFTLGSGAPVAKVSVGSETVTEGQSVSVTLSFTDSNGNAIAELGSSDAECSYREKYRYLDLSIQEYDAGSETWNEINQVHMNKVPGSTTANGGQLGSQPGGRRIVFHGEGFISGMAVADAMAEFTLAPQETRPAATVRISLAGSYGYNIYDVYAATVLTDTEGNPIVRESYSSEYDAEAIIKLPIGKTYSLAVMALDYSMAYMTVCQVDLTAAADGDEVTVSLAADDSWITHEIPMQEDDGSYIYVRNLAITPFVDFPAYKLTGAGTNGHIEMLYTSMLGETQLYLDVMPDSYEMENYEYPPVFTMKQEADLSEASTLQVGCSKTITLTVETGADSAILTPVITDAYGNEMTGAYYVSRYGSIEGGDIAEGDMTVEKPTMVYPTVTVYGSDGGKLFTENTAFLPVTLEGLEEGSYAATIVWRSSDIDFTGEQVSFTIGEGGTETPVIPVLQVPTAFRAAVNGGIVNLSWAAPANGCAGYLLLRDGEILAEPEGDAVTYTDKNVAGGGYYMYTLYAIDEEGNRSEAVTAGAAISAGADTDAPVWGGNAELIAGIGDGGICLSWSRAQDTGSGVTSYLLLCNGEEIAQLFTRRYTYAAAQPNTEYVFSVKAVDGVGNVSEALTAEAVSVPSGILGAALGYARNRLGYMTGTTLSVQVKTTADLKLPAVTVAYTRSDGSYAVLTPDVTGAAGSFAANLSLPDDFKQLDQVTVTCGDHEYTCLTAPVIRCYAHVEVTVDLAEAAAIYPAAVLTLYAPEVGYAYSYPISGMAGTVEADVIADDDYQLTLADSNGNVLLARQADLSADARITLDEEDTRFLQLTVEDGYAGLAVTVTTDGKTVSGTLDESGTAVWGNGGRFLSVGDSAAVCIPKLKHSEELTFDKVVNQKSIRPGYETLSVPVSVVDDQGKGIPGIEVRLTGSEGSETKTTGPDGTCVFTFENRIYHTPYLSMQQQRDDQGRLWAAFSIAVEEAAVVLRPAVMYDRILIRAVPDMDVDLEKVSFTVNNDPVSVKNGVISAGRDGGWKTGESITVSAEYQADGVTYVGRASFVLNAQSQTVELPMREGVHVTVSLSDDGDPMQGVKRYFSVYDSDRRLTAAFSTYNPSSTVVLEKGERYVVLASWSGIPVLSGHHGSVRATVVAAEGCEVTLELMADSNLGLTQMFLMENGFRHAPAVSMLNNGDLQVTLNLTAWPIGDPKIFEAYNVITVPAGARNITCSTGYILDEESGLLTLQDDLTQKRDYSMERISFIIPADSIPTEFLLRSITRYRYDGMECQRVNNEFELADYLMQVSVPGRISAAALHSDGLTLNIQLPVARSDGKLEVYADDILLAAVAADRQIKLVVYPQNRLGVCTLRVVYTAENGFTLSRAATCEITADTRPVLQSAQVWLAGTGAYLGDMLDPQGTMYYNATYLAGLTCQATFSHPELVERVWLCGKTESKFDRFELFWSDEENAFVAQGQIGTLVNPFSALWIEFDEKPRSAEDTANDVMGELTVDRELTYTPQENPDNPYFYAPDPDLGEKVQEQALSDWEKYVQLVNGGLYEMDGEDTVDALNELFGEDGVWNLPATTDGEHHFSMRYGYDPETVARKLASDEAFTVTVNGEKRKVLIEFEEENGDLYICYYGLGDLLIPAVPEAGEPMMAAAGSLWAGLKDFVKRHWEDGMEVKEKYDEYGWIGEGLWEELNKDPEDGGTPEGDGDPCGNGNGNGTGKQTREQRRQQIDEMYDEGWEAAKAISEAVSMVGDFFGLGSSMFGEFLTQDGGAGHAMYELQKNRHHELDDYLDEIDEDAFADEPEDPCDQEEDPGKEDDEDKDKDKEKEHPKLGYQPVYPLVDPSGYLYAGAPGYPVQGVKAHLYYLEADGAGWTLWNSEDFGQGPNPYPSEANGYYGWDVLPGKWKVVFQGEGYANAESTVLDVPPPHMDVDIAMTSTRNPQILDVSVKADGSIYFKFDHPMTTESVLHNAVTVTLGSEALTGTLEAVNGTVTALGIKQAALNTNVQAGQEVASVFRFVPDDVLLAGMTVEVTVDGSVLSYSGLPMLSGWTDRLTVPERDDALHFVSLERIREDELYLNVGDSYTLNGEDWYALFSDGFGGEEKRADINIKWSSNNEAVATVDENGKITAVGGGIASVIGQYEGHTVVFGVSVTRTPIRADAAENKVKFCREQNLVLGKACYMWSDAANFRLEDPMEGDEKYMPAAWRIKEAGAVMAEGTVSDGEASIKLIYTPTALGTLTGEIDYQKYVYTGGRWVASGSPKTATRNITVTEVTGLTLHTAPKTAKAGEVLDLSAMRIGIALSDGSVSTVGYEKLASYGITMNLKHGDALGEEDTVLILTHTRTGITLKHALQTEDGDHICKEHLTPIAKTDATCTEDGCKAHYKCSCGKYFEDASASVEITDMETWKVGAGKIAAPGHREVTDMAVAATCTETGLTEGKHCSVCNTILVVQETLHALGHSWGQWVETVKPDETRDGVDTRVCTACGETETKVIDNNIFTDVKTDRFEAAILWAYYNNITTGTGDGTTFSPENACTRKQIVTFLWRAAGEPEPESMVNPFKDVKSDRFEKAILWAYYAGITAGTGDGSTFSPENTCTRKQIVTFLWRYNGQPAPKSMENKFVDVKNDRFTAAILWAAEQGITTGTGDGTTFSPEDPCTRKQIVTFLFRNLNKEEDK